MSVDRLPLTSQPPDADRVAALKTLFPEAFPEGNLDFDRLKRALGQRVSTDRERYGLSWAGKSDALHVLQSLSVGTLESMRAESVNFDTTENVTIDGFTSSMLDATKSLYDAIVIDSAPERGFAAAFESREGIKFYLKLPAWFKIPTPLRTYNPDWALVKQDGDGEPRLYLVRETKSTLRQFELRNSEEMKIWCGRAHFDALVPGMYDKACDPTQV